MRICYIAADVVVPHFRGASTHVYELSRNLVRIGHEVHLVSRRESPSQKGYEELDGIEIYRIHRGIAIPIKSTSYSKPREHRTSRLLEILYRLYLFTLHAFYVAIFSVDLVRREKIDAIIERETSFGAGAITSALTGRPMVLEVIGPRISWLSLRMARKVLAYTQMMVADKIKTDKLVIVTAAVDSELFKPDMNQRNEIRLRYGLAENLVVGYVGTFQPWHGVLELIQASKDILKRHPHVRFLMVGPYHSQAEAWTLKLDIRDAYTFTGPVEYQDVPKYINASDILVAPYNPGRSALRKKYGIGSPLKIFEYMACGKPLIATSVKPITDLVKDRENGILILPGDVECLKSALNELIANKALVEEIGERGRECVVNLYSWKNLARNFEHVLSEIVRGIDSRHVNTREMEDHS